MKRVLLVEDNDVNREMVTRRLGRRGYEIIVAVNGREAVDKVCAERPHIVLMDMDLPLLSGTQATAAIRQTPDVASTPIIALTAHAMCGDFKLALDAGFDDYVTKPIDFGKLVAVIESLTGGAPLERAAV